MAPLVEAVLDVQFQEHLTTHELEAVCSRLQGRYPNLQKIHQQHVTYNAENNSLSVLDPTVQYRCEALDISQVALLRPDGFATSQLAPYRDWTSLSGRFTEDLQDVLAVVGERAFRRLAVRSINRIDVPADGGLIRYEDFLTVYPNVPDELGPLAGFQSSVLLPVPDIGGEATITVYRDANAVEGIASFIVDVDVYRQAGVPTFGRDFNGLLLAFREAKNRIYRACLTPRALKEFQE